MLVINALGNVDFLNSVLVVNQHGVFSEPFSFLASVFLSIESTLVFRMGVCMEMLLLIYLWGKGN